MPIPPDGVLLGRAVEEVDRLRAERDRYRAAWQSARRRAEDRMASASEMVREFHRAFSLPIRDVPTAEPAEAELRLDLLEEEFSEYRWALELTGIVEIADALADMVYVIYGTALAHGIDLDAVIAEVHRSNMSKLGTDGKPIYREDGKVLKGPNYSRPNIVGILAAADAADGRTPDEPIDPNGHVEPGQFPPDDGRTPDDEDDERFCARCFAGLESSEHHEKCVTDDEQLVELVVDAILEHTTHNGMDCGPAPTPITDLARAVVDALKDRAADDVS